MCSTGRGSSVVPTQPSNLFAQSVRKPEVHSYNWTGGTSRLHTSGKGAKPLVQHELLGVEPQQLWADPADALGFKASAAACADALGRHVPVQELLPILCRPDHVVARRNFARVPAKQTCTSGVAPRKNLLLQQLLHKSPSRSSEASVGDILLDQVLSNPATPEPGLPPSASPSGVILGQWEVEDGSIAETPLQGTREEAIAHRRLRLRRRVEQYGVTLDSAADDGNCLFRAVAKQLYGRAEHHALVRHLVVARLHQERAAYEPFFEGGASEMEDYLVVMAKEGTWGDELALKAIADVYDAELHVLTSASSGFYMLYTSASSTRSVATKQSEQPRIFLAYTYPVHYDGLLGLPLRPVGENGVPANFTPHRPMLARTCGAVAAASPLLSPREICFGLSMTPSP